LNSFLHFSVLRQSLAPAVLIIPPLCALFDDTRGQPKKPRVSPAENTGSNFAREQRWLLSSHHRLKQPRCRPSSRPLHPRRNHESHRRWHRHPNEARQQQTQARTHTVSIPNPMEDTMFPTTRRLLNSCVRCSSSSSSSRRRWGNNPSPT
jgi:hypothetical protein